MELFNFLFSLPEDEKSHVCKQLSKSFNRPEKREFEKLSINQKIAYITNYKNGSKEFLRELDLIYNGNDEEISRLSYGELIEKINEDNKQDWNKYTIRILYKCQSGEDGKKNLNEFYRSDAFKSVCDGEWIHSDKDVPDEKPVDVSRIVEFISGERSEERTETFGDEDGTSDDNDGERLPPSSSSDMAVFLGYVEQRKTYYNFNVQYQLVDGEPVPLSEDERCYRFPMYGWINLGIAQRRPSAVFMDGLNIDVHSDDEICCNSLMALSVYEAELVENDHPNMYVKCDLQFMYDNGVRLRDRLRSIEEYRMFKIVTPVEPCSIREMGSRVIFINEDYSANTRVLLECEGVLYGPVPIRENRSDKSKFIRFDNTVIDSYAFEDCSLMTFVKYDDNRALTPLHVRVARPEGAPSKTDILSDARLIEELNAAVDISSAITSPAEFMAKLRTSQFMSNVDESVRASRMKKIEEYVFMSSRLNDKKNELAGILTSNPELTEEVLGERIAEIPSYKALLAENEKFRKQLTELEEVNKNLSKKENPRVLAKQAAIEELRSEQNRLKREINQLTDKYKELVKLDEIASETDRLRREKHAAEKSIEEMEEKINGLRGKIASVVAEGFNEAKVAFDPYIASELQNAVESFRGDEDEKKYAAVAEKMINSHAVRFDPDKLADKLVNDVKMFRSYEVNDILNMYICVAQSFLTVFSGKPGTGKTSICYIIAASLGLNNFHMDSDICTDRFIPLSVEKGWTSKRDLIGYYNPLTRKYDRSNSRLYDSLMILNAERERSAFPCMVLLDEANLSPMEYYWADFMKLTDAARGDAMLNIGMKNEIFIPDTLRFLATINNDRTTEQLSPRLIDRSWIIRLPDNVPIKDNVPDMRQYFDGIRIAKEDIKAAFDSNPCGRPFKLNDVLEKIYRIFEDADMMVSARVRIAIRRYLETAQNLMYDTPRCSSDEAALDFAVVQKLLPKINGPLKCYEVLFEKLGEISKANNLVMTGKTIAEMQKQAAANMGYCRFLV